MTRIRNDIQYNAAMARIEELLKVVNDDTPQESREYAELDLLSGLVADYEQEKYPVDTPTLPAVLSLRMYELGLTQTALASMLEVSPSRISEYMSGRREPTLKIARLMSEKLSIDPAIVLGVC